MRPGGNDGPKLTQDDNEDMDVTRVYQYDLIVLQHTFFQLTRKQEACRPI